MPHRLCSSGDARLVLRWPQGQKRSMLLGVILKRRSWLAQASLWPKPGRRVKRQARQTCCSSLICDKAVAGQCVKSNPSLCFVCLQEVRFLDIGDEAIACIVSVLQQQQQQGAHGVVRQHPDLAAAMLQGVQFEYVNGMEWGFYNAELQTDVSYSVSCIPHSCGTASLSVLRFCVRRNWSRGTAQSSCWYGVDACCYGVDASQGIQ